VVAWWASRALATVILADLTIPTSFDAAPDPRVMALMLAAAIVAGVGFSLAPCWWVIRQRTASSLRVDSRTVQGSGRFGPALVATQIALAVILVVHAGLLVRTLQHVQAIDSGLDADDAFVAFTSPVVGGYKGVDNNAYYPALIARLQGVPGVESASVSLLKPGGGGGITSSVRPVGSAPDSAAPEVTRTPVAPDFFRTLGIPMRAGRDFTWRDNSVGPPVAVISESVARRLYGGRTAIGEHIRVGSQPRLQDVEIVGVVADSRVYDPKNDNLDAVYMPALQDPDDASYKCLVIRGRGVARTDLDRAVSSLGREYIFSTDSFNYIVGRTLLRERLTAVLAAFFGLLALVLSAIGIYGLMSYTVSQRRREAGIRLALGEEPRQILARVLRSALGISVLGTVAGLGVSLGTVTLAGALLFQVAPRDPATFALAGVVMALVALAAAALPARRLARVDPLLALRED
jgi:putative ABC transport system permease protein